MTAAFPGNRGETIGKRTVPVKVYHQVLQAHKLKLHKVIVWPLAAHLWTKR